MPDTTQLALYLAAALVFAITPGPGIFYVAARTLAGGLPRKQVATQLGISIHTVTTMCKRIYAKLGVRSQAELAARL